MILKIRKKIFTLIKQSGLSNIEISESLNISIKTVEGHIRKHSNCFAKKLKSSVKIFLINFKCLRNNKIQHTTNFPQTTPP